jgi:iron complex outermembrane receptor protein
MISHVAPASLDTYFFQRKIMRIMKAATISTPMLLIASTIAALSTPATAQERAMEEIVVTALKGSTGTALSDTPIGITALDGAFLESINATGINDIVERTPGASLFKLGPRATTIQIRGISASRGDALVGYYLDDFAYVNLLGVSTPEIVPFDLERVEVLKGPQGTLYGAGSTGGTIRILSEKADTYGGFNGKIELAAHTIEGGDDGTTVAGMLNIPIVPDKLALRLSANIRDQAGWLDYTNGPDDFNDTDGKDYKVKLGFTPNDRLRIDLGYQKYEIDSSPMYSDSNLVFARPAGTDDPFTPLAASIATGAAAAEFEKAMGPLYPFFEETIVQQLDSIYTDNVASLMPSSPGTISESPVGPAGMLPFDEGDYELYTSALTYDFDAVQLYLTVNHIDESGEGLGQMALARDGVAGSDLDTTNVELRLASKNDGPLNWTAGYFYLDHDETFQLAAAINPILDPSLEAGSVELPGVGEIPVPAITSFASVTLVDSKVQSEQNAVFGEISYQFTENVELTVGARYFEDDRDAKELQPAVAGFMAADGLPNPWSDTFDGFTGRVNLKVNWSDDLMSYFSVSSGQRSGTPNFGVTQVADFINRPAGYKAPPFTDEEKLYAYEIGAKWFATNELYINASVYYNDWQDIILELTELYIDPQIGIVTSGSVRENAGDAESYGLETSINYVPTDSLTMTAGFNLMDSEYSNPPEGSGVSSGDQIQAVPDWTGFASVDFSTPVSQFENSAFAAGLFATYMGERYSYGSGGESAKTKGYTRVDARAGLEAESWSVVLHVKNLTDADDRTFNPVGTLAIDPFDVYMQPRTTELVLKYAF